MTTMPTPPHRKAVISNGPDEFTLREVAELLGHTRSWAYKQHYKHVRSDGTEGLATVQTPGGRRVLRAEFERFKREQARREHERPKVDTVTEQLMARIRGRIGGLTRSALHPPRDLTKAARDGTRRKYERMVDPDGTMEPAAREMAVARLEHAHMLELTLQRLRRPHPSA